MLGARVISDDNVEVTATANPAKKSSDRPPDVALPDARDLRPYLAGLLATGTGLAAGELTAAIGKWNSPIVSVGNRVVDRVPHALKQWAIETFGTSDKQALQYSTIIVVLVLGAVAGFAAAKRFRAGIAFGVALGLFAVVCATVGRGTDTADAIPAIIAASVAVGALWFLVGRRSSADSVPASATAVRDRAEPMPTRRSMATVDRRGFLRASGLVAGAGAAAGLTSKALRNNVKPTVATADGALPVAAKVLPTVNASTQVDVPNMTPFVTPNSGFYRIDTALVVPRVDAKRWKLTVGGMVGTERSYTYEELLARKLVEIDCTILCVSNDIGGDLIGNARWLGVPLSEILDEVAPDPAADQLASESEDGWTCGFPTKLARDGRNAIIALGMNGEPLPYSHGFPARLIIPGIYGYVSATKWLKRIELTTMDGFNGYWVPRGWAKLGPIKTGSRIDVPGSGEDIPAGATAIAGVAWAQHRGIRKVEVQVDDGAWMPAELAADGGIDTWRQWKVRWDATAGRHRIRVRATDETGETQTEVCAPVDPDGATGWHTLTVHVA